MSALLVALLSSLAWAGFDVSRKSLVRQMEPLALMAWFGLGQCPGFLIWALVDPAPAKLTEDYLLPGSGCLAVNVAASAFFFYAVKVSPLSRTIPLLSLTPAFALLLGELLLDETPTLSQGGGIGCIVLGALLLNARGEDARRPWRVLLSLTRERGSLYMGAVALFWAISPVLDKLSLPHSSVGIHAAVQTGGVSLCALLWLVASNRVRALRLNRKAGWGLLIGLAFSIGALGMQLVALQQLFVSLVEAIKRAVGGVASVVNGHVLFDEPIRAPQVAAVALMTLGVFLAV